MYSLIKSLTSTEYPRKADGTEIVADEIDEWAIGIKLCPGGVAQ